MDINPLYFQNQLKKSPVKIAKVVPQIAASSLLHQIVGDMSEEQKKPVFISQYVQTEQEQAVPEQLTNNNQKNIEQINEEPVKANTELAQVQKVQSPYQKDDQLSNYIKNQLQKVSIVFTDQASSNLPPQEVNQAELVSENKNTNDQNESYQLSEKHNIQQKISQFDTKSAKQTPIKIAQSQQQNTDSTKEIQNLKPIVKLKKLNQRKNKSVSKINEELIELNGQNDPKSVLQVEQKNIDQLALKLPKSPVKLLDLNKDIIHRQKNNRAQSVRLIYNSYIQMNAITSSPKLKQMYQKIQQRYAQIQKIDKLNKSVNFGGFRKIKRNKSIEKLQHIASVNNIDSQPQSQQPNFPLTKNTQQKLDVVEKLSGVVQSLYSQKQPHRLQRIQRTLSHQIAPSMMIYKNLSVKSMFQTQKPEDMSILLPKIQHPHLLKTDDYAYFDKYINKSNFKYQNNALDQQDRQEIDINIQKTIEQISVLQKRLSKMNYKQNKI